jgi:hypothetical protein
LVSSYPATVTVLQGGVTQTPTTYGVWSDWADAGSALTISETITVSSTERYHTPDTTSWTVDSTFSASVTYYRQWKVSVTFENVDNNHKVDITQRTLDGSAALVVGISVSLWAGWCDDSTTLSFSQETTGGSNTERWHTYDVRSWNVLSAFLATISYIHQYKPSITVIGLPSSHPAEITVVQGGVTNNPRTPDSWSDWADADSTLSVSGTVTVVVDEERYYTSSIVSWTVSSAFSKTVTYVKQFYLNVQATPGNLILNPLPTGEGWYEEGSIVQATAPKEGLIDKSETYCFHEWRGTASGLATGDPIQISDPITMNSSKTAIAKYVKPHKIPVGNKYTIYVTTQGNTDVEVTIDQILLSGYYVAVEDATNPGKIPKGWLEAGKYVDILSNILSSSGDITWPIEIRIYYDPDELSALNMDEETLQMRYWDGTDWVELTDIDPRDTTGVNTEDNYIWARVYHFSKYGAFGEQLTSALAAADGVAKDKGDDSPRAFPSDLSFGIGWVRVGDRPIEQLEILSFFSGIKFDIKISAVEPTNLGMNAWINLLTPDGTKLVYPMISTLKEYTRQEFSATIDTTALVPGNYTMQIQVENAEGERDAYGPINFSILIEVPPSPFAGLLTSPALIEGTMLIIVSVLTAAIGLYLIASILAAAVWLYLQKSKPISSPLTEFNGVFLFYSAVDHYS